MRTTSAPILLLLFLITTGSLALIGWLGYKSASRLADASEQIREISRLRTQLNTLLMEIARLDALSLRDVLSDEPLYEDPVATEESLRERLRELGADLRAAGVDGPQVDALDEHTADLLRSGREQLALKTTEPRELAQHAEVARTSVHRQELVAASGLSLDLELERLTADAADMVDAESHLLVFYLILAAAFGLIVIIGASVVIYRLGRW